MNFIEAVKLLKLDKDIKIKRRNFDFQITSDTLGICTLDFAIEDVISNPIVETILAEDWYVVKDEKLHTFEEAIEALKKGKTISSLSVNERATFVLKYNISGVCLFGKDHILANDWIIIDKEGENA